jgi:MFS family permease
MTQAPPPDSAADADGLRRLLGERSFTRYLLTRFVASFGVQMQTVAVGIQVYALRHSPLDLGLVGLSQFLPFVLLVLVAGQVADRFDRRRIGLACLVVQFACAAALAAFTVLGLASPLPVFAVMVAFGISRAFQMPASQSLLPNLVPPALFRRAVAITSSSWQVATIAGPGIGGIVYAAAGPATVYALVAGLLAVAMVCLAGVRPPPRAEPATASSWRSMVEGLRFVWRQKVVLGAISMDLFAVLFGGATALLPAYAAEVLHTGAAGIGWLRAAPAAGAVAMAASLTLRPISRRAGHALFAAVAGFGVATIVFGASTDYALSLAALALLGAADMVSIFVRQVLVQLETPDAMRGRVAAVSSMFIGASNELGEFESGLTAAWWGLEPAVVIGGCATIVVAALWARLFPALWRLNALRRD